MQRIRASYGALVVLALAFVTQTAWACRHQAPRHATIAVQDIEIIEIAATSGDLRIQGKEGLSEITVEGIACAQDEDQLPHIKISSQRINERLRIIAEVPYEEDQDWRVGHLDLTVSVPTTLPVELSDSSGGIQIDDIASLTLTDTSGDVDLRRVAGQVLILRDSSGDIRVRDVGPVVIQVDSSGEIDVQHAESVVVELDTSGDIEISDVLQDVSIGSDSSGAIAVKRIGGDFSVANDSSGGIQHSEVAGEVRLPPQH